MVLLLKIFFKRLLKVLLGLLPLDTIFFNFFFCLSMVLLAPRAAAIIVLGVRGITTWIGVLRRHRLWGTSAWSIFHVSVNDGHHHSVLTSTYCLRHKPKNSHPLLYSL